LPVVKRHVGHVSTLDIFRFHPCFKATVPYTRAPPSINSLLLGTPMPKVSSDAGERRGDGVGHLLNLILDAFG